MRHIFTFVCVFLSFKHINAVAINEDQKGECLYSIEKDICNSKACPGFTWCELCEKCLLEEHAVKDEL